MAFDIDTPPTSPAPKFKRLFVEAAFARLTNRSGRVTEVQGLSFFTLMAKSPRQHSTVKHGTGSCRHGWSRIDCLVASCGVDAGALCLSTFVVGSAVPTRTTESRWKSKADGSNMDVVRPFGRDGTMSPYLSIDTDMDKVDVGEARNERKDPDSGCWITRWAKGAQCYSLEELKLVDSVPGRHRSTRDISSGTALCMGCLQLFTLSQVL
ncbi:hypothetical protein BDN72DRAFT_300574 [Pluteus cervinus]|uniref:Uncharacterized protein n=1 Tax=Pluteus cervinus TaxID=181527 RepID=A0ACD3AE22_9AGAR|nr:hypothetical protein BDN72DRAFT_300574 [Pluteus cervinus]